MPKTSRKPDPIAVLAEGLILALESGRARGGDAYPTTLRRLAEVGNGAFSAEKVLKAATKKAFTSRAVVTAKVDGKPALDAPVYFKEDVPKPEELLATRMLLVLESQRELGGDAYPTTLGRLAELCGLMPSNALVPKAANRLKATGRAIVAADRTKGRPEIEAPTLFQEDIERHFPVLLRFALRPAEGKGKSKARTCAFPLADVPKKLVPALREAFEAELRRRIDREDLPPGVAWVEIKGKPHLFLVENMRPGATSARAVRDVSPIQATPARDFAEAFRAAFERLDRGNGGSNFVKLADLRRALPEFGREAFDAGLRRLREGGLYSLDSHEGLHGSLTPDEREAGVREAGSLLVYASRR